MKKILLALSAVALLFATSCKKESVNPAIDVPEGSFLATIDNGANPQNAPVVKDDMGTMTTIDGSNYVIWENEDEIKINGVSYTTDTEGSSSVVFTPSDPAQQAIGTTFHAFFPATIAGTDNAGTLPATQTIELDDNNNITVRNLPMYATSNNNQLTFHNICAALKITIPSFLNGATSIEVSSSDKAMNGAFTITDNAAVMTATTPTDAEKKITVQKSSGTFATNEVVYIAVPANTYSNFKVEFFSNTTSIWAKTLTSQTLAVNKVYNINISDPNLLPGLFTINQNGDQVMFTKGNLNGSSPNYGFETSQLALGSSYLWSTAWLSPVTVSGSEYRVLSEDEWIYLINRTITGTTTSPKKYPVTINGDIGYLVLFPDTYTGTVQDTYTAAEWQTAEAAGAVCLRYCEKDLDCDDYMYDLETNGYYWSSTYLDDDYIGVFKFSYNIFIEDGNINNVWNNVETLYYDNSDECPIRLVKDNQ